MRILKTYNLHHYIIIIIIPSLLSYIIRQPMFSKTISLITHFSEYKLHVKSNINNFTNRNQ